ncbi:phospho-N-acetylmuramoyl-pentapeptide-transferase [Leucobacter weissii]|uniref:Phospho-N-acetylmuramoyl-pentapeptide-transferase n=1 Tax=Leucobacter weissii TaxID=1983706 RepID=A0A939MJB0_9MICO|nr:phospho-N-acetylmuramoyl-pentapeptide-transferase [Leucobacter weissii]MBO1902009.1 phospho-N-acetylmuramoyl-pentapeptide-transferase [Leucobacter weissii]
MIALLFAGGISMLFSLLLTPLFIRLFTRLRWGQFIREDGPQSHHAKRGTPTMGGLIFISGSVIAYFLAKLLAGEQPTASALLVILLTVGLGAVGFIDDFLKTRKQQSLGLGGWAKIAGQVVVAVAFGVLALQFANERGLTPASSHISLFRELPFDFMSLGPVLGLVLFLLWIILIVTAASNSVNVTDGLDGLAGGASILAIGAYAVIGFWQFSQLCARHIEPGCYEVRDPLDLAVIAAALVGGLVGFIWWNANPAHIYMGDTGSLGLGGAIAAFAVLSHTELLLLLIGGLFVIESGSVIVQRLYFKITRGKRIFLMSPIHHHFELKGWAETAVVVRFWIVAGVFVLSGLGALYTEWTLLQ